MGHFIRRRILYSAITLLILTVSIFAAVRLTGGDPALMMAEPGASPEDLARLRHDWGLDRELPFQYASFLGNTVTGELGRSFNYRLPVRELYFERLVTSLQLALAATLVSIILGIPAGIISAVKLNSWWDRITQLVGLLGLSIPGFWLGMVLIYVFGVKLGWLPTGGKGGLDHLVMPAITLGWYFGASLFRLTRSSMLETLGSDYIKLARLKGVPEWVVIAKHAFKNALIPVLTLGGLQLVLMVNVAVVIEVIFAWPGIGSLLFDAILQRDFPLVQGIVLMSGVMIIVINLIIDALYAYIDPRIRLE